MSYEPKTPGGPRREAVLPSELELGPAYTSSSPIRTLTTRLTAAGRVVGSFLARAHDAMSVALLALYGITEMTTIERGPLCDCREDVHRRDECPRALEADCSTCGQTVLLDRWMQCSRAGARYRYHPVTNRRPRRSSNGGGLHEIATIQGRRSGVGTAAPIGARS